MIGIIGTEKIIELTCSALKMPKIRRARENKVKIRLQKILNESLGSFVRLNSLEEIEARV